MFLQRISTCRNFFLEKYLFETMNIKYPHSRVSHSSISPSYLVEIHFTIQTALLFPLYVLLGCDDSSTCSSFPRSILPMDLNTIEYDQ